MAYDQPTYRRREDADEVDPSAYRGYTSNDYRGRRRSPSNDEDTGIRLPEPSVEGHRHAASSGGGPDGELTSGWAIDGGRDRLGIHIGWEVVLLVAVAALALLEYRLDPASLRRPALDTLLISATTIGLIGLGAGLTLRAGAPNLALGPIALASALHYAENGDRGLVDAVAPALGFAALGGIVVGLFVVVFHVPGWAATLAAAFGVVVYDQLRVAPVNVQPSYDPSNQALLLFGGFALLAMVGGALGALRPVRRSLGHLRPIGNPARRRGPAVLLPVIGSLVLSSALAVVAGVLIAADSPTPVAPGTGLELTGLGLGVALLGGTSVFGRRGGVVGTFLATCVLALFVDYQHRRNFDIAIFAIGGATIAIGLVISRLIETYGGPLPRRGAGGDSDWQPDDSAANWSPELPSAFSPAMPAQGRADRWDDNRWGSAAQ
jgi:ribose/xylose/arabinose/galactoside ABC-type transport system permease subunit